MSATIMDVHRVSSLAEAREYTNWVRGVTERSGVDMLQVYEVVEIKSGALCQR